MHAEWVAAWATVGGAVATAATGVAIVFQTVATRRSVEVSQAVQTQAAKARLDDRAPRLSLTMDAVRWPPHRPASHDVTLARGPAVAWSEQFRLPRDGQHRLLLEAFGRLRNDGDKTITVEVTQPLVSWPPELERPEESRTSRASDGVLKDEHRRAERRMQLQTAHSTTVTLAPGGVEHLRLRQEVAVEDLAAACAALEPVALAVAELVVDDGFDEGVTDTHRLTLTGHAMTPVPDDDAGYTVPGLGVDGQPPVHASPVVVSRRYYLSKSAGQEMPTTAATVRRARQPLDDGHSWP